MRTRPNQIIRILVQGFGPAVAWWIAATAAQAAPAGFPLIEAFSSEVIGTNARSWVTVQDRDGVVHFGCDALVSFDGERWTATKVPGAHVWRGLDFGPDGRLWAAAIGELGWFKRLPTGGWSYHSLLSHLPPSHRNPGEIWHAFADGTGAIFISDEAVLRWDGRGFEAWPLPGGRRLPAMRINGIIYVHHPPTGLYAVEPAGPRRLATAEILGSSRMILWMESCEGGWLLATSDGFFRLVRDQLAPLAWPASHFAREKRLTCAARLPDGRLAIGTFQGGVGVMRPDGSLEQVLGTENGLPSQAINSLLVDREARLWGTSTSQVFRLALGSPTRVFDRRSGLPEQPSLAIARLRDELIVSTQQGVFSLRESARQFTRHAHLNAMPWVWDLRMGPQGILAAGHRGVIASSGTSSTTVYQTHRDVFVVTPSTNAPDQLLLAEGRTIVAVSPGSTPRIVGRDLPDDANSIAEDARGRLWLGTPANGVFVTAAGPEGDAVAVPAAGSHGLPGTTGQSWTARAHDGGILVCLPEGAWWLGPRHDRFRPVDGYPRRAPARVTPFDADDSAWVLLSGQDGRPPTVGRVRLRNGTAAWEPHAVEGLTAMGAPDSIFAEPRAGGGTTLWIGGSRGLLRHEVTTGPQAPPPGPPLVRAIARITGAGPLEPLPAILPHSVHSVTLQFAAPEFSRRALLRIESTVTGVDDDWQPAGAGSQRELGALRDGDYTVRVRTVAETGTASEVVTLAFTVAPPWWRTLPALGGFGLATALALGAGHRLRLRALRRRNAELEEKVRQRTEQLTVANAAKTQFLANMSHDIRNPLNGIVGLAFALDRSRLSPEDRAALATLRECTSYLSSLVDDILDFAAIEAGQIDLRPRPYAPAELLRSVATMLAPEAASRGARFEVEIAPGLPAFLLGDAGRIQQVLVNFSTNALKYAGGRIRLSVGPTSEGGPHVEFRVHDEGPSFTPAEQAALFSKFSRLPGPQRDREPGTGLGLAACQHLATALGGTVGVTAEPTVGKRFFLRLPRQEATPPVAAAPEVIGDVSVLVVEDADYNAAAAAAVLASIGLGCERAATGAEAIARFAARPYQVVLLDRNLPDLDGTDVATRIRALEAGERRALILAVTAYCTPEDRAACLAAGMDDFLGKPLTPEKLRRAFAGAARLPRSAGSIQVVAGAAGPAIDLTLLHYLADETPDGLPRQARRLLAELARTEADLAAALEAADRPAIARAAHALVAHARLVDHAGLAGAARDLERAAAAAGPLAASHATVTREVEAFRAAVTAAAAGTSPA